jgi:hypothetical protein
MNLDHDLRRAFRRQPAPPDFADRVMARLEGRAAPSDATPSTSPRLATVRWLAAAAAVTLMAVGGAQYYGHRQAVAEAERVQNEVRLALQIAGEKLALLQRKLQEPHR